MVGGRSQRVEPQPRHGQRLQLGDQLKEMGVAHLRTIAPVETLDVGNLARLARMNVVDRHPVIGAPVDERLREDLDHPTGADAASQVNRPAFTGPLVDDCQAFERLPIRTGVEDEVVCPHVVPGGRSQRPGPSRGHRATGAPPRDLLYFP